MSVGQDAIVNTQAFRKDFRLVLACDRHLCIMLPVRLGYDASGYYAGTVLGKKTADGLFYAYNDGHSDGTEVARCILFADVLDMPASSGSPANASALSTGIFGGLVFKANLTGYDAAALVDFKGTELDDSSGLGTIVSF